MAITYNKSIKTEKDMKSIISHLVYMNDGIRICSEACSCCWDKKNPDSYEDKVNYLGKRCETGHTSILEHSNLIIVVKMPDYVQDTNLIATFDALSSCKYINVIMRQGSDNVPYFLIGGSYRGYIELFKLSNDPTVNVFLRSVSKVLYQNLDAKIFYDLTKDNILNVDSFKGVEPDPINDTFNPIRETPIYEDDKIKVISFDNIEQIKINLINIIGENIFTTDDIFRVASISILFKDMSRTATHQLVRHRNGITQESQRYVDYSHAAFADPVTFKPDKYDPDKKYDFKFGGHNFSMTSNEIGEAIIGIYHYMFEQGMLKEDARSFLPGNVKCRRLYMTFTFKSFIKFLELRCHLAAQAEIRSFALSCRDAKDLIDNTYMNEVRVQGVDEIISDKEVIMNNLIENEPELKNEEEN